MANNLIIHPFLLLCIAVSLSYSQGYKRFHQGNSLSGGVWGIFTELAHDGGFPDDQFKKVGAAGTPVDWAWENMTGQFIQMLEDEAPFDFVQVQPFHSRREPEDVADAILQIHETALKHSPACTLLVYYTWVRNPDTHSSFDEWKDELNKYIDSTLIPATDLLEQYCPDNPVYVIPTSPAFYALQDSIDAGKLPRFTNAGDLYRDGIHMNANGNYLNACVHYAAIYQKSPEGLPHDYTVNAAIYTTEVDLTDEEAAIFQRTAWDVVRNYPRTLVSKKARNKTDTEVPSNVNGLSTTNAAKMSYSISWDASTDNTGVKEYLVYAYPVNRTLKEYATYRWVGSSENISAEIFGSSNPPIQPGVTYKTYVRAMDAQYNLSPPSDTITVEIPETVKGNSYAFDFGTGESPVKDGFTEVLRREVYHPATGYGYTRYINGRDYNDGAGNDALLEDGHRHLSNSTEFLVDMENGQHSVNVFLGPGESVDVYAEGTLVLEDVTTASGESTSRNFTVQVDDEQLTIKFGGSGWMKIAGLEIESATNTSGRQMQKLNNHNPRIMQKTLGKEIVASIPGETNVRCDLLDLSGRIIDSYLSKTGQVVLSTKSVRSGVYILRLQSGAFILNRKIVIHYK